MSIDDKHINKTMEFYAYDFSAYYPHLLSKFDLQMPIKEGKLSKILDLKCYHLISILNSKGQLDQIVENQKGLV